MSERPANSKPNYPIPWIATYFLTALILIAGSFAVVWYLNRFASGYDYDDPDMDFLEGIVQSPAPHRGDFSALNGGDWQALCLVGWRGNPSEALLAAKVPDSLARTILKQAGSVEHEAGETEFVLVYADAKGRVKVLRHPHGFAFAHKGSAVCTTAAQPVLRLPASN
ncbi:MAG: hypothetical protein ACE5FM_01200 [Methyloligellaceae bacterium]